MNHNYTQQGWISETVNWDEEMKDKRSQAYSLTPFINGQIEN